MIQANELRRGNWVKIKYVYTKVWSLDNEGINLIPKYNRYANQDYVAPRFYYKDISPISLTEDWLLKFGFEHKSNGGESMFKNYWLPNGIGISLAVEDIDFGWISEKGCFYIGDNHTKIDTVHWLQNYIYFNYNGHELEIKNA